MRDDVVQARFRLTRRDPRAEEEPLSIAPDALVEDAIPALETPVRPIFGVAAAPVASRVPTQQPPAPDLDLDVEPPSSGNASSVDFGPSLDLDIDRGAIAAAPPQMPVTSTFDLDLRPPPKAAPVLEPPAPPSVRPEPQVSTAVSPAWQPPAQPRIESRPRMDAVAPRVSSRPRVEAVQAAISGAPSANLGAAMTELLARARAANASD